MSLFKSPIKLLAVELSNPVLHQRSSSLVNQNRDVVLWNESYERTLIYKLSKLSFGSIQCSKYYAKELINSISTGRFPTFDLSVQLLDNGINVLGFLFSGRISSSGPGIVGEDGLQPSSCE
ncbi:hypothetical protein ACOME3_006175 [Neoechinorhynchus agilis]